MDLRFKDNRHTRTRALFENAQLVVPVEMIKQSQEHNQIEPGQIELAHVGMNEPDRTQIRVGRLANCARVHGSHGATFITGDLGEQARAGAKIHDTRSFGRNPRQNKTK
jgi:hypothetical protein